MTKLLGLLGLTTILSGTSALILTPTNNNTTNLINQENDSFEINDINITTNVKVKNANDIIEDEQLYESYLNISWDEASLIHSGEITNFFSYSLNSDTYTTNKIMLQKKPNPVTDAILLSGTFYGANKENIAGITISIIISPDLNNSNITYVSTYIISRAVNFNQNPNCSASAIIDKLTLFKK